MHIWITRPLEKSTALAEALQRRGLQTIVQPALNIEDYGDTRLLERFLTNPRRYFVALFVSAEAARRFAMVAEKTIAHPPAMAIGGATKNALGKSFAKIVCPQNVGDTPALLHNPMLSRPANKQIAIFGGLRGDDPESLSPALCRALVRQGAKITTIPLYRRVAPKGDSGISVMGTSGQLGAAVAYSAETLLYMEEMTAPDNRWLKELPLFVIHPSIMDAARMRGFGNVTVSMPAPETMATAIAEVMK
ncbi:MAG: uroporphyrinogen-III synthase [Gammaproteobacteria bacterium]